MRTVSFFPSVFSKAHRKFKQDICMTQETDASRVTILKRSRERQCPKLSRNKKNTLHTFLFSSKTKPIHQIRVESTFFLFHHMNVCLTSDTVLQFFVKKYFHQQQRNTQHATRSNRVECCRTLRDAKTMSVPFVDHTGRLDAKGSVKKLRMLFSTDFGQTHG